jgi:hypothetical protein
LESSTSFITSGMTAWVSFNAPKRSSHAARSGVLSALKYMLQARQQVPRLHPRDEASERDVHVPDAVAAEEGLPSFSAPSKVSAAANNCFCPSTFSSSVLPIIIIMNELNSCTKEKSQTNKFTFLWN